MPIFSSIVEDLKAELNKTKQAINNGAISDKLKQELTANEALLQGWINKIVGNGELGTQDTTAVTNALVDSKKKTLEAQAAKTKRTIIFIGIGIVIIIGGIVFITHKKKTA